MKLLSIHPRHDANLAIRTEAGYHVIELERLFGERHLDWMRPETPGLTPQSVSRRLADYVAEHFPGRFDAGVATQRSLPPVEDFGIAAWHTYTHHRSHAAVSFYQSPFRRALVVSYDGGGEDGYFRPFLADYAKGVQYLGNGLPLNLGSAYAVLAEPIREIRRSTSSLFPNAGKMMGLAGFGAPVQAWLPAIAAFYRDTRASTARLKLLPALGKELGLDLSGKSLEGQLAADYAASCQRAFEDLLFEALLPLIREHRLPLCLSGGCALNVTFNEKLSKRIDVPIFVPPNPNDCGLALGALFLHEPPEASVNITYSGLPLLDLEGLESYPHKRRVSPSQVAALLAAGQVIGVARGGSEHGPRALGNRSILADPGVPGIKDRLNAKIKFRESFRPYGPVTRAKDVSRYFESGDYDMSFMSFNPQVRPEWRRLGAITHVDGSARVQTVSETQSPWLHEVLGEFERIQGYSVLLNTSLNMRGNPILTTIREALAMLQSTEIDGIVIDDWLCWRESDARLRAPA